MKNLIFVFFLIEYVLCRNLNTDLARDRLEKLTRLKNTLKEISKYSSSNLELQAINEDDVTLFIYTRANSNGVEVPLTAANTITEVSPFNTNLKTVFYVHGWQDTATDEGCTQVRTALLDAGNVNVISVNWDKCAGNIDYFASQRCVADVGQYVGQFIETVAQTYQYSLSDITVAGHSLGAHIAGHVGKYTNGALGTIVGLDPAGPFYSEDDKSARLNEDDAQYVQAIHTDGSLWGVNFNVGDADFWPNGGLSQNGCGIDVKCSHKKSHIYYAESLTSNNFYARKCDSYDHFENNNCQQNAKALMGGINVDTSAVGNYYLDTNPNSPFGMGDVV